MEEVGESRAARAGSGAPSSSLSVVLRLERGGPEATREAATEAELIDVRSETWLAGVLRRGGIDVALDDVETRMVPTHSATGKCSGFAVEIADPAGVPFRRDFTVHSLDAVADRAAQRLVASGRMKAEDLYFYEILVEPTKPVDPAGSVKRHVALQTRPLVTVPVPIGRLLEQARHVGPTVDPECCPVFYTEQALERAETCSRRGADRNPPVESGGVLVGVLGNDPDSGELGVIVLDVLEAIDAEESEFALCYSGETWARIQAMMNARQSQPETAGHRIVGQCHGHNFLPGNGSLPCEACSHLAVCEKSSVFVSQDDLNWARAVFRRQPWQLNQIFGLNARREKVHGLFGLRDGRLLKRGFHVIAGFDADA